MSFRKRLSKGASRRSFRRSSGTHRKNMRSPIMRGGIRM